MLGKLTGGGSLENVQKLHNDIFCLTQERDFFKQKFSEQVDEIDDLKGEVAKAKKEIDRLREELVNMDLLFATQDESREPLQESAPHVSEKEVAEGTTAEEEVKAKGTETPQKENDQPEVDQLQNDEELKDTLSLTDESSKADDESEESETAEKSCEEKEADDIRAQAEKMLIWANYQTKRKPSTRSSTASTGGSTQTPSSPDQESSLGGTAQSTATPTQFYHSPGVPTTIHASSPQRRGPLASLKKLLDPQQDDESDYDSDYDSDCESYTEADAPERKGPLARLETIVNKL